MHMNSADALLIYNNLESTTQNGVIGPHSEQHSWQSQ